MNWSHQKVLITGAGGFIGSHLTERLVELGAKTSCLVRYRSDNAWGWLDRSPVKKDITVFSGDIRDPDSFRKALQGVDSVFHLAALIGIPYSYHSPLAYVRTNIEGTVNVLQQSMAAGVSRFVHTSTSEVYGTARYVPIDEHHPLQGNSPYSATKIAADKLVESFYRAYDFPCSIARPFNTFGPRQSARAIIPTIILQLQSGVPLQLGNLHPTRDFNFVSDTVNGFIRIAETPKSVGEVINIGSGGEISIADLIRMLEKITGKRAKIQEDPERVRPEKSEVERLCAANTRAKEWLRWRPEVSLETGLQKTAEWIGQNPECFRESNAYVV